jgi:hypothetical protein
MHRDQGPVRDHTRDAHSIRVLCGRGRTGDEVFDSRGVEELDVGELQHLAQQRRREECSMLHDNEVALVLVRHTDLVQKELCRLAHHHGTKELPAEPGTTAGGHAGFDHGDLEIGALARERVSCAETARACANDDDVGLGVGVQVVEVATRHGARDLRLADGSEGERFPVVLNLSERLGYAIGSGLDSKVFLETQAITSAGDWHVESGSRRRHVVEKGSRELEIWDLLRLPS